MRLDILLEALLFYKAAPQSKQKIQTLFAVPETELAQAILVLRERLENGATRLLETDTEVQLTTAPELAEFIEAQRKQDMAGDIGKAGAETLAIILYREPISRAEIDNIRGVNSSFILRNLLTRGLITRQSVGGQSYQFRISTNLLQHLGITHKQSLPRFSEFRDAIDTFDQIKT